MRKLNFIFMSSIFIISASVQAWPGEKTYELLDRLKDVKCSLTQSYLLQTKEGEPVTEREPAKVILMDNVQVVPSSSSRFATYSVSWENDDFSFYFSQGSQTGFIRLLDKNRGVEIDSSLDIYDLDKDWPYLGSVSVSKVEDVILTSSRSGNKVPGEKYTYLKGTCHRLSSYLP